MTSEEYQRQAFRGFKESKDYKFVNLSFGLISAVGNIAYAISNAGKYHDLALSDEELNNALPRLFGAPRSSGSPQQRPLVHHRLCTMPRLQARGSHEQKH